MPGACFLWTGQAPRQVRVAPAPSQRGSPWLHSEGGHCQASPHSSSSLVTRAFLQRDLDPMKIPPSLPGSPGTRLLHQYGFEVSCLILKSPHQSLFMSIWLMRPLGTGAVSLNVPVVLWTPLGNSQHEALGLLGCGSAAAAWAEAATLDQLPSTPGSRCLGLGPEQVCWRPGSGLDTSRWLSTENDSVLSKFGSFIYLITW